MMLPNRLWKQYAIIKHTDNEKLQIETPETGNLWNLLKSSGSFDSAEEMKEIWLFVMKTVWSDKGYALRRIYVIRPPVGRGVS
jgi:hypothetical protein